MGILGGSLGMFLGVSCIGLAGQGLEMVEGLISRASKRTGKEKDATTASKKGTD